MPYMRIDGTIHRNVRDFSSWSSGYGVEYYNYGGDDFIIATKYDDWLTSFWEGNDTFYGGAGNDMLQTGSGEDWLVGGTGADVLSGGPDHDWISYADSDAGVEVDLAKGRGHGGEAEGDVINQVESILGSEHADILTGDAGRNNLHGGKGDDRLAGGANQNVLLGGVGDDMLIGQGNAETLDGGSGDDTVSYAEKTGMVLVDLEREKQGGAAQNDTLSGIENLIGTRFGDQLHGDDGRNVLTGGDGNDSLHGRGGADTLYGGKDFNTATYHDSPGAVRIDLTTGRGFGADAQGDLLFGIAIVRGSAFGDTLIGSIGPQQLLGQDGNDTLIGGTGDDTLIGGEGRDTLYGGDGQDTLFGGAGSDILSDSDRHAKFDGGSGLDHVTYADWRSAVMVDLASGQGGLAADQHRFTSVEWVTGSIRNDVLLGSARADMLYGERGDDILMGRQGGDILNGGSGFDIASYLQASAGVRVDLNVGRGTGGEAQGDTLYGIEMLNGSNFGDHLSGSARRDTLLGDGGADVLEGLGGKDIFAFEDLADSGKTKGSADYIVDFLRGDRIDLSAIDAQANRWGDQEFDYVGSAAFSAQGQIRSWSDGTDTYVALNAAGDNQTDMLIRLGGIVDLGASSFVL